MTYVVIGANGGIGGALAQQLDQGHSVLATARDPSTSPAYLETCKPPH